jgi:hypothetical protein
VDRRTAFGVAAAALAGVTLGKREPPRDNMEQFFKGTLTLNEWRKIEGKEPIGELGDARYVQPISNLLSS